MKKIALNFICKNESHVVARMLSSTLPVIDLIVAVDTGSSDDTIDIIKAFGRDKGIPTFVFERSFDNFCNSRNCALDNLKKVVGELSWDPEEIWGLYIDCDEMLLVTSNFRKQEIHFDVNIIRVMGQGVSFTRQCLFHLSKELQWEGPIHEIITWKDSAVTLDRLDTLRIRFENVGGSWKGDLEQKYLRHAEMLADYVQEGHSKSRWARYAGCSYVSAAGYSPVDANKVRYAECAKKWFEKALELGPGSADSMALVHTYLADVRTKLGDDWSETRELLLKGYSFDTRKVESISKILVYYISIKNWNIAYVLSSFAVKRYHGYDPYENGAIEAEDPLYSWKLLYYHSICCYKTGRWSEAVKARKQLKAVIKNLPIPLSPKDRMKIRDSRPFNLWLNRNEITK